MQFWNLQGKISFPTQNFVVLNLNSINKLGGGTKDDWDFRISDLTKTLIELLFNPYGEFWWSPEGLVSQVHSPHLRAGVPGIFSDLLRSVQMLKREWDVESSGKLPHLLIPSKITTLVPEFAVEDLPLDRTTTLIPAFAEEDCLWAECSDNDDRFN